MVESEDAQDFGMGLSWMLQIEIILPRFSMQVSGCRIFSSTSESTSETGIRSGSAFHKLPGLIKLSWVHLQLSDADEVIACLCLRRKIKLSRTLWTILKGRKTDKSNDR